MSITMVSNKDRKSGIEDLALFKLEAARLRKEFDAKIGGILERIRERNIQEIKKRIQA